MQPQHQGGTESPRRGRLYCYLGGRLPYSGSIPVAALNDDFTLQGV